MSISKSEIISALREVAGELEHRPNEGEIEWYSDCTVSQVLDQFNSLEVAYRRAELPESRSLEPTAPITDTNSRYFTNESKQHDLNATNQSLSV